MTQPEPVHEFIEVLQSEASVAFEIDEPSNPDGEWWIDIEIDGMHANISWKIATGFGIFNNESGYGGRPQEIYRNPDEASVRILQLAAQWRKNSRFEKLNLSDLRHLLGETQSSLAHNLGTDQARVSRLEKGRDIKLSTLVNYLGAMGGRLELRAHFPSFEAPIEPIQPMAIKLQQS